MMADTIDEWHEVSFRVKGEGEILIADSVEGAKLFDKAVKINVRRKVKKYKAQIVKAIPEIKHTKEELSEMNSHLDSRSQQYWSAYNDGFIQALSDIRKALGIDNG